MSETETGSNFGGADQRGDFGGADQRGDFGGADQRGDFGGADQRGDIPPYRYTAALAGAIEARWQDRWDAEQAPSRRRTRPGRSPTARCSRPAPRSLPDGHVPVPERRGTARRAPAGLHRHRRAGPLPAHDRAHRAAHDGLRRVRAARRAVRGADRHAPARHDRGEHRALPRPDPPARAGARRPAGRWPPPTSSSTAGPSGSSCRSSTGRGTTRGGRGRARSTELEASSPRAIRAVPTAGTGRRCRVPSGTAYWTTTGWPTSPRPR